MFHGLVKGAFQAFWLLFVVVACGCAHKGGPVPYVSVEPAADFPSPLAVAPTVVTDPTPIKFISFSAADHARQRKEAEDERRMRIDHRVSAATSRDMAEVPLAIPYCIVRTFIIFSPACAVIIPGALVASNVSERRAANRDDPALPALPAERELVQIQERISRGFAADRLVGHMLSVSQAEGGAMEGAPYPRLVIRTESAKLTMVGEIEIHVSATGEPAEGITWVPTDHGYHFKYTSGMDLERALGDAEGQLALSIRSYYFKP